MTDAFDALPPLEPTLLVATFSTDGRSLFQNDAWRDTFGSACGGGAEWQCLADDDQERAAQYVQEAASGSLVTNRVFDVAVRGRDEPLPVLLNFLPIHLPEPGTRREVQAVAITGEVLAEPTSWTQSQTQRNRLETLGRMTMGIAHDFNNLLSGILGYTELLKTHAAAEPSLAEPLRTIEQAALDGAALVRKIQQYIRQEKQTHFEPIDLPGLIRDCIALTRPYWYNEPRRQGIAIHAEERFEPVPPVTGDPTELREVFINLILNAVQAMPQGGTLTFTTRRQADGGVLACVQDTGTGMPESVRTRIFEPLFTTKGERGTGMGLAVSYGIIQEHEGAIAVRSEPGAGTTFEITLPPAEAAAPAEAPAAQRSATAKARILVVDDEPMVRGILAKLLALKGHTVVQAPSGAEGLAAAEAETFDVVFTDHGMPEMNGRQFARALRSRFPVLPIVLLTGDTEVGEAGDDVNVVLAKPFKIDELEATIQELLKRKGGGAGSE